MMKTLTLLAVAIFALSGCAPVVVIPPVETVPYVFSSPPGSGTATPEPVPLRPGEVPDHVSLCDLQRESDRGAGRNRAVAITAGVGYDFEYGFSLHDSGCKGSHGLPAALMSLRGPDSPAFDALELQWASAPSNLGRRPMCVCVGRVAFYGDSLQFQLLKVESTWWEGSPVARGSGPAGGGADGR